MAIFIEEGSPKTLDGRSEAELSAYAYLDALGVPYTRADHEAAATMEDCESIGQALDCHVCKNLFLTNRQGTAFYLLLMPADKPFKTKELSSQINSARLSFASPEKMMELLGTYPGAATVLGLMHDKEKAVSLLIDEDLLSEPYLGVHPLVNTSMLRIETKALLSLFLKKTGHSYRTVHLVGVE